jgi:hypothetical protein
MLEEQNLMERILSINSLEVNGIQELMAISNKLDKHIQNMNGDIFELIDSKSENIGLL